MVALTILIILTTVIVTVSGDRKTITRKYGTANPYFNQTSWGYFRIVQGSTEIVRVPTIWMQDDLNKRMRIDVGSRSQAGFQAEFYFFNNSAYEVIGGPNGPNGPNDTYHCTMMPDFNYSMEISTYGEPNFGFLGRHTLQEYNGITADVYVGQGVDGVGPLNCLYYCDTETCTKFLDLTCIGAANRFSYNEYWFGDNLTSAIPPASFFTLPPECARPQIEYYFDIHNADGSMKTTPTTATDFCSGPSSTDMPMLLYRSICCGLHTQLSNGIAN